MGSHASPTVQEDTRAPTTYHQASDVHLDVGKHAVGVLEDAKDAWDRMKLGS